MCRTCQNVYELTTKWKVYWMDLVKGKPDTYQFEYVEWVFADYSCVIAHVKMNKVSFVCVTLYYM